MRPSITGDTTDAELWAPIESTKALLAAKATSSDSETLAGLVNSIARAEGVAEVNYLLRNGLAIGASAVALERAILQVALQQGDDIYSGRTNDARRARRDGVVARARELTQHDGIQRYLESLER